MRSQQMSNFRFHSNEDARFWFRKSEGKEEKKDQVSRSIERQVTQREQSLRLCVIYDATQGNFEWIYVVLCCRMDERWKRVILGGRV